MYRFLLIFLALGITLPCQADSAVQALDLRDNHATTGLATQYLVETEYLAHIEQQPGLPSQPVDLQQILQAEKDGRFQAVARPVASFGLQDSGIWLKISVHNPERRPLLRRLTLKTAWLWQVDFHVLHQGKLEKQLSTGLSRPLASRQVNDRLFTFEHSFAPGGSSIYLRLQSHEPMILPIAMGDLAYSQREHTFQAYSYGLLYGIVGGLMLFNLLLYVSIHQSRYLFYVLYLAMYLFNNLAFTGHGYYYLWQDASGFQYWANALSITLYASAGVLFALSFLRIRQYLDKTWRATLWGCALICLLQLLFIATGMSVASVKLALLYLMLFSLLTFFYAILSYRRGYRDAVYYMVATLATLVAATITPLSVLDIIPFSNLTFHAGEIAVAFDAILLSIALASQIRHAQMEKVEAQQLARTDILTNLDNRRGFEEISRDIWRESIAFDRPLCFIMLDIDHFKQINDRYGHSTGDKVLQAVSRLLTQSVRENDALVRWGGEEFAILLPDTDIQSATGLAERIRRTMAALSIATDNDSIKISVSLGVAARNVEMKTIEELFEIADRFLYHAKTSGRNRVCSEI